MGNQEHQKTKKEKIAETSKRYRERHREQIREKQNQKIRCNCGLELYKRKLIPHLAKGLHTKLINERYQLLEQKTNPDITKKILEFLE